MYSSIKSTKTIWKALDKRFKVEVAGMKKFIVNKFLDFKMVSSKIIIMSQVQEFQLTLHDIYAKYIVINEHSQVVAIIKKLSWS